MVLKKFANALAYAITAGAATWTLVTADTSAAGSAVTLQEWVTVGFVIVPAFWGKFSTNTRLLMPSRRGETLQDG